MELLQLFLTFAKIGLFTVGGGYAMIPFVQKETVEIHKWITAKDFADILAMDTVTPGPIAVNMATFIGYKVQGIPGAIIATLGVVLPSLILVTIIAAFFYSFRSSKYVIALLKGLKPAVIALIAASLYLLIQQKAIFDYRSAFIAIIVFAGIVVFRVHPMWLILSSAIAGFAFYLK